MDYLSQEIAGKRVRLNSCRGRLDDIQQRISKLELLKEKVHAAQDKVEQFRQSKSREVSDMVELPYNLKAVFRYGEEQQFYLCGGRYRQCRNTAEDIIYEINAKIRMYEEEIWSLNLEIASLTAAINDLSSRISCMED